MKTSTARGIKKIVKAFETMEGGGVLIQRALPHRQLPLEDTDPFLLLDEAVIDPSGPGFPEHPHRGFEILTYILEGWGSHKDNLGNEGRIEAGGIMKLTAGSGIWHGEQAGPSTGSGQSSAHAHGIQFWVNLPIAEKKRKPEFQLVQKAQLPELREKGSVTKVLVGPSSPVAIVTPMQYLDVSLELGAEWHWDLAPDWQGYFYVLEGQGSFGAGLKPGGKGDLLLLGEGGAASAKNESKAPLRFLMAAGQPLHQRVVWNGPFVD